MEKRHVFVSYSRTSAAAVESLRRDLEVLDCTVWHDQELSGGHIWWDDILQQIRECQVFVFVLDPTSLASVACRREYEYADQLGKPLLPVLVANGVATRLLPPALSRIQHVDYRTRDADTALKLSRALATLPPPGPLPDPLPEPPDTPISLLGALSARVASDKPLGAEAQAQLLLDLKQAARDPANASDARDLLQHFRKRPDLLAQVAQEIDEATARVTAQVEHDAYVGELLDATRRANGLPEAPELDEIPVAMPVAMPVDVDRVQAQSLRDLRFRGAAYCLKWGVPIFFGLTVLSQVLIRGSSATLSLVAFQALLELLPVFLGLLLAGWTCAMRKWPTRMTLACLLPLSLMPLFLGTSGVGALGLLAGVLGLPLIATLTVLACGRRYPSVEDAW